MSKLQWVPRLIPSEFSTMDNLPELCLRALTEDNRALEVLLWGKGSESAPFQLLVRIETDPPPRGPVEEAPHSRAPRQPTLEELQEAVDRVTPAGTLLSMGYITSRGPAATGPAFELPENAEWLGLALSQIGVENNSDASRRSSIILPQKRGHNAN